MINNCKIFLLSTEGNRFITPHFQVKEFAQKGATNVTISVDLVTKLELLSDCINNKAIHITKTYNPGRVTVKANQYSSYELSILAQACGFSYVKPVNSTTLDLCDDSVIISQDDYFVNYGEWIHIRKIPFNQIDHLRIIETRESVKTTAAKFPEYDFGTNGTFFCTYMEPQFNLKINGLVLKSYPNHKWGMIFTKDRIRYGELSTGNTFVSGHPILLDNGRFCDYTYASEIDGERARTAWGYDDDNLYILVCEADRGLTLRGLRQVMSYIGCKYAINLDGGGSASLFEKGKVVNLQGDQRKVNNCILIKLKEVNLYE